MSIALVGTARFMKAKKEGVWILKYYRRTLTGAGKLQWATGGGKIGGDSRSGVPDGSSASLPIFFWTPDARERFAREDHG